MLDSQTIIALVNPPVISLKAHGRLLWQGSYSLEPGMRFLSITSMFDSACNQEPQGQSSNSTLNFQQMVKDLTIPCDSQRLRALLNRVLRST